jgi:hypothetical protein
MPFFTSFLPFGTLAAVYGWLSKYRKLETDDPDFPEAKQAVKKALIFWIVLSAIHILFLINLFVYRIV